MKKTGLFFIVMFFAVNLTIAQNEDAEGCKDHPLFTRMPNFHILDCVNKEFDSYKFTIENSTAEDAKKENVEGKYCYNNYGVNEGITPPSALQLFRNFENALTAIKATIVGKVVEADNSNSFICAKITQGKNETWVCINAYGPEYRLYIVEREAMVQVIKASAMLSALNTDGFIALDILFDTGKSTIKTESLPIVDEIYSMLKDNAALKVSIEGHTDNVGDEAFNKKLSEERAKAVMDALITKGIGKERLTVVGWGQTKPVADNRTEEGRSKNRRVEIVKK